MKKVATLLVFSLVIGLAPAWAIDGPVDEGLAKLADHDSYAVKVPGMALHGIYEIAEAPLELLNKPYEEIVEKDHYVTGSWNGLDKGAFGLLEGTTRGIFNIFRSFVPGVGRYEDKDHQTRILPGVAE